MGELISKIGNAQLSQIWEWFKVFKALNGSGARMADLMRVLVMYFYGGVHLDADSIPCGGLEHMVDQPGVVSFPYHLDSDLDQVNGNMVSAPPRHRLFGVALESFIARGEKMKWMNNLSAAGPVAFAIATDAYFK